MGARLGFLSSIVQEASLLDKPYRFASTRHRVAPSFGSNFNSYCYALHESVFYSPDYDVVNPRFFLANFIAPGSVYPVDRYCEGQIAYYGVALKVGSTWYKLPNSTDRTVGVDNVGGTIIGPVDKGTVVVDGTSSAARLSFQSTPQIGDMVLYVNGSTRTQMVISGISGTAGAWDVVGSTYSSGSSNYATDNPVAMPTAAVCYLMREPGWLTPALALTIPAGTPCRLQLLWGAQSTGGAIPTGITVPLAGVIPRLNRIAGEKVTAAVDLATTNAYNCSATLTAMFGTDTLFNTANATHSGFYNTNSSQGLIHTAAFMVAQGGDGRPVYLVTGDTVAYGSLDEVSELAGDYYSQGYIQRGLDENVQSKRVSYGVFAEKGTGPQRYSDPRWWKGRRDALTIVKKLNRGVNPFTAILDASGFTNQSLALATARPYMTAMLTSFKNDFNCPIIGMEQLPRPTSTDGFQTLENQALITNSKYNANPALLGGLWGMNYDRGGDGGNNSPTATLRVAGLIDDSFAPWKAISYDTASNRDHVAIRAITATTTADFPVAGSGIYSLDILVTAGVGPRVGEIVEFGTSMVITQVTDNGGGAYNVKGYLTNFAVPTVAIAAGAVVTINHLSVGPWTSANLLAPTVVSWKIARGLGR